MLHSGQWDCSLFDYFMVREKVKCWCESPDISNRYGRIYQQRRGWQVGQLHHFTSRVWILTTRDSILFQFILPKSNNLKEAKDSRWEIWPDLGKDLLGPLIATQTRWMVTAKSQPWKGQSYSLVNRTHMNTERFTSWSSVSLEPVD